MGILTRTQSHRIQTRTGISLPEKVFIGKDADQFEYSHMEPSQLVSALLDGYYSNQNYINLFYSVPEVFAPVHEIARRVSDCNWELLKEWNDEVDYKDKEFNRLFSTPNPLMDIKDLIYQAVCYELLTGRQFFYMNRPSTLSNDYENILSWYNLQEPQVKVSQIRNADIYSATTIDDLVTDYRIGGRIFDSHNVMPVFNLHLDGNFDLNKCQSYLKGADMAIKNLIPVYQARGVIYIKRGMMGLIVSKKVDQSGSTALLPKEKKALRDEINKDFGLTGGRDTLAISEMPVDFVRTSMSIEELQPFDETLADALAIYKTLRVPQHLVPRKDQSTFNNTESEMTGFYNDVIIPFAKRYASIFTTRMGFDKKRKWIRANYSHIEYLQGDLKKKAEVDQTNGNVYMLRFKNGVCSLNDWVVSTGNSRVTMPLYEKKIFEMTPEELDLLRNTLNLNTNVNNTSGKDTEKKD